MARKFARTTRNILSSLADIAGDWLFWFYTVRDNPNIDKFDLPVFVFAAISAFFGLCTIYVEYCKYSDANYCRCRYNEANGCCGNLKVACLANKAQLAEIVIEDIPQIILSVLVTLELKRWTPTSSLNLATSIYNLCFDILDIAEGDDEPAGKKAADEEEGSYRASTY